MIVIQSESFFDVRRLGDTIAPRLFRCFDDARREAVWRGEMTVPAWGANTMRTEFAVLTGTESFALGYARFIRTPLSGVESRHSHPGWDVAVTRQLQYTPITRISSGGTVYFRCSALPVSSISIILRPLRVPVRTWRMQPLNAIVSTLEAADRDRPVHLRHDNGEPRSVAPRARLPGESSSRHTLGEDPSWRDLTAYLRHIENADAMIGRLLDHLRASDRETVVCFTATMFPRYLTYSKSWAFLHKPATTSFGEITAQMLPNAGLQRGNAEQPHA